MIQIKFPDASVRRFESGITVLEVAKNISEGLARSVLSAKFNHQTVEGSTPLFEDGHIQLFTWNDQQGKDAFWHSSAHVLAQTILSLYPKAKLTIGPAIENPLNALNINTMGTCNVLQCAREVKAKKVLYSSTSSGYGLNEAPNIETQPDDCLNPYSVSKIAGEKLCKMYTDLYGLNTIIFRYFNVFGERAPRKGQYAPVTGIFLRQKAAGEPLTIVGDGEQRRDYIYVEDVANANVMAAISNPDDDAYGQVYNVGSGKNYSVNEIASFISDDTINIPPRIGEARNSLANIDKIQKTFAWKPEVDVEQWIKTQL